MTAVLFDLFGVLLKNHDATARAHLEHVTGFRGPRFWEAYWRSRPAYDAGQSSRTYWRTVAAQLEAPVPDIEEAVAADSAGWTEPEPDVVSISLQCRRLGFTVGLLSNIPADLRDAVSIRHHRWLPDPDNVTWSCDVGVTKPNPLIYFHAVERLGHHPSDVLFVDDRRENVLAAQRAGMRVHLFTDTETLRKSLDLA